jgi:hypothetical protein
VGDDAGDAEAICAPLAGVAVTAAAAAALPAGMTAVAGKVAGMEADTAASAMMVPTDTDLAPFTPANPCEGNTEMAADGAEAPVDATTAIAGVGVGGAPPTCALTGKAVIGCSVEEARVAVVGRTRMAVTGVTWCAMTDPWWRTETATRGWEAWEACDPAALLSSSEAKERGTGLDPDELCDETDSEGDSGAKAGAAPGPVRRAGKLKRRAVFGDTGAEGLERLRAALALRSPPVEERCSWRSSPST